MGPRGAGGEEAVMMATRLVRCARVLALLCGGCGGPVPTAGSQVVRAEVPGAAVSVLSVDGAAVVWIVDR